jgi:hypothetical protein
MLLEIRIGSYDWNSGCDISNFSIKDRSKIEEVLSFSQIAALRYADDHQFGNLIERAVKEKLSSKEILKSIQNWQVDTMRL